MLVDLDGVVTEKDALIFISGHSDVFNLNPTPDAVKSISGENLKKLHAIFYSDRVKICSTKRATIQRLTSYMFTMDRALAFERKTFEDS